AIVAQQGHGLVSYPLREDTAFRLSDGVADRIHVDEPSAIKAKRGLGVEDLANRVVEASAADLATLHCSHHGVERCPKIGGDDDHVVARLEGFDGGAAVGEHSG